MMQQKVWPTALAALFLIILVIGGGIMLANHSEPTPAEATAAAPLGPAIDLPPPNLVGSMPVEQALFERRSIRAYQDSPLTLSELSQLLWAAQGVTHPNGWRTAASAGGLYPLELLAAVGNVVGLEPGVYRYDPAGHQIRLQRPGDQRVAIMEASLDQASLGESAVILALAGVYERTAVRYGARGQQYVHMEVGIASQNIHLQAVALGLGTVFIGAFHEDQTRPILGLADDERLLSLMPVGRP